MSEATPPAPPLQASVRIAAPPDVVFPYFTDPALATTWIAEQRGSRRAPGRRVRHRRPWQPRPWHFRRDRPTPPRRVHVGRRRRGRHAAGQHDGRGGARGRRRRHRGDPHPSRPPRELPCVAPRRVARVSGPAGGGGRVRTLRHGGRSSASTLRRPGRGPAAGECLAERGGGHPRIIETRTCYSFGPARP